MKKIIFFSIIVLSIIVGSDDSSKLDDFEESLTKKKDKSSTSQNESSTNNDSCNTHSYCNSNCNTCLKHKNNKSNLFNFLESLESASKIVKISSYIAKGVFFAITYPIQLADNLDNSDGHELTFDKYPFYNSSGMYNYGTGKSKFFKSEISQFSFDDSIYGNKNKINFQNQRHIYSFSYINLKEKYNSQLISKSIRYLMYSNMFSVNNKTSNDNSLDFTLGIGLSIWNSNTYKDSGIRLESSYNSFFKPFSFNLITGYSFIGNGIFDLEARASYHYKRLSLSVGHQRLKVPSGSLIKGTAYSLGFWF